MNRIYHLHLCWPERPLYTISEKTPFSAFMAEKQEAVSKRCFRPVTQNEKRSINYKKDGKLKYQASISSLDPDHYVYRTAGSPAMWGILRKIGKLAKNP